MQKVIGNVAITAVYVVAMWFMTGWAITILERIGG
jgi:hypothetical protein